MKKKSWLVALLFGCICLALGLAACSGESDPKGLETISITNKTALTAEWVEGEADREVNISLAPNQYTLDNTDVIIESDNTNVAVAEGNRIKAVGGGVAKITAYYGSVSDSVSVIVTPKLKKIEISNKAELTSAWVTGDDDRTVKVNFNPDYFNNANPNVEVSSDTISVVSVDGNRLKAEGIGEAIITAKVGDFTDSVKVVVRPELNDFTITNASELASEWDLGTGKRNIEISFGDSEYWTTDNTEITVVSSNRKAVENDGMTLNAVGVGAARVNVQIRNITKMFTVNVILGAPVFTVDGDTDISFMAGGSAKLPTITAMLSDQSAEIPANKIDVKLSDSDRMTITNDNTLEISEFGEYTITYTAVDSRIPEKKGELVFNIVVGKQLFKDNNKCYEISGIKADPKEQTVKSTTNDYAYAAFDIEPSKNYYAEAVFEGRRFFTLDMGYMFVGMGHYVKDVDSRILTSFVLSGNKDHKVKDLDTSAEHWNYEEATDASNVFYSYRLGEYRGLKIGHSNSDTITYAVARIGDDFFVFINDVYVCSLSPEFYRDKDTMPGLFGKELSQMSITGISFYDGVQAKTKVSELLDGGSGFVSAYVPYGDWDKNSKDKTNFTVNTATAERGANFDFNKTTTDFNDGMVSPYIYLDGDFTFEWEYKPTNVADGWENGMVFELRNRKYENSVITFGVQFNNKVNGYGTTWDGDPNDPTTNRGVRFVADMRDAGNRGEWHQTNYYIENGQSQKGDAIGPNNVYANVMQYGVKLRVSRKIENGKATMTYSIMPYTDSNKTVDAKHTFTVTYTDIDETNYGAGWQDCTGVLQIVWHNKFAAGEYSNIRWAHVADFKWN